MNQPGSQSSDPEKVLSQALRAMAGGSTGNRSGTGSGSTVGPSGRSPHFTVTQVLLIAAIIGVVVGMGLALVLLAVS